MIVMQKKLQIHNFHTIKSILNFHTKHLYTPQYKDFHTIKSILNIRISYLLV